MKHLKVSLDQFICFWRHRFPLGNRRLRKVSITEKHRELLIAFCLVTWVNVLLDCIESALFWRLADVSLMKPHVQGHHQLTYFHPSWCCWFFPARKLPDTACTQKNFPKQVESDFAPPTWESCDFWALHWILMYLKESWVPNTLKWMNGVQDKAQKVSRQWPPTRDLVSTALWALFALVSFCPGCNEVFLHNVSFYTFWPSRTSCDEFSCDMNSA